MAGASSYCYRDVLPFAAMVTIECITVGGTTLYKTASSHGLNYYVFIVYTFLIGSLLLLPYPFIIHRRTGLPPLKISVAVKISLLGLIGMEKLNLRSFTSQVKMVGWIVSIAGALVATLYNGPRILTTTLFDSSNLNWIIGGILLAAQNLLLSFIYVFQAQIMQEYPVDLIVVLGYDLSGLVVAALAGLIMARDLDAWKVKPDLALASIVYLGFTAGFVSGIIHTWALRLKGPVYIAIVYCDCSFDGCHITW